MTNLSPMSGQGSGAVEFQTAANPAGTTREGILVVNDARARVVQAAAPCQIQLSSSSYVAPPEGGAGSIAISALQGCTWNAASQVPWIAVTSGESGNGGGTVIFSVQPLAGGARTGTIVIGGRTFTVHQSPEVCAYIAHTNMTTIAAAGGSGTVTVQTSGTCQWQPSSTVPWVTIPAATLRTGGGSFTFNVAANTGAARSGSVSAGNATVTITQAAVAVTCSPAINPTSQAAAAAGDNGTIAVTAASTCAWTAVSNAAWITIATGSSGSGNGTVTFNVAANPGGARSDTITAATQTFTVSQAAATPSCSYSINPTSRNVDQSGAPSTSVSVAAGSGCAWTATSNASWLTITQGASGTGDGTVAYSADANNTTSARSGTLTIAGLTYTVSQAALSCSFTVKPDDRNVGQLGGTGSVNVNTSAGCAWSATSNDAWIVITGGATGTGDGTVSYLVSPNLLGDRSGTVTIAGRTFTVNQDGLLE